MKEFFEISATYAENILTASAARRSACGHHRESTEGARWLPRRCLDQGRWFIRTCDAFNLPLVTFEDVPVPPGVVQEWGGIIRHGAKLLYAKQPSRSSRHHERAYEGPRLPCKH